MPFPEEMPDIKARRLSFESRVANEARNNRAEGIQLARAMVSCMAHDTRFTTDDFIFAASLGDPLACGQEQATLDAIAALKVGEVVGVAHDGLLRAVGIAGRDPLQLRVYRGTQAVPTQPHTDRQLTASLRMSVASRLPDPDGPHSKHTPLFHERGYSVPVLTVIGEPERPGNPFKGSGTVIAGAEAVLDHITHGDALGTKQVSQVFNHLAKLATQ